MPRKPFGRSRWALACFWWLAAACLLLPGTAHAAPNVEVRVRCPALESEPELRAELEARALVELSVRRQSSGVLSVECDDSGAELSWSSAGQVVTHRVPARADGRLLVDELVAALWNLTAPSSKPAAAPPQPQAPAQVPTPRPLAVGLVGGGRLELWPRAPNALPAGELGLELLGEGFVASALGHYGGGFEEVEGLRSRVLGAGVAFDFRPLALRPLAFGVGLDASRFSVRAPVALTPAEASTWTLSTSLRLRFFQRFRAVTLALGPELLLYPVRARVWVGDHAPLASPLFAGAFTFELGYLLRR